MNFFKIKISEDRIFGLDLLRFLAIFFVLLGHSIILVPDSLKEPMRMFILDGVGIFFVLSGYLIGNILLKQILKGKTKIKDLFEFWKRRWLRTIPAYFFVLIFLLIYTSFFVPFKIPENWYKYFIFSQNLNDIQPSFFQESWSLSIEEWFYLTIPIVFFIFVINFKKNLNILLFILITFLILLILSYRLHLYFQLINNEKINFATDVLQQIIPRLDGIMIGVFGAFLSIFYPLFWEKLNNSKILFSMFLMLFILKFINNSNESIYYCVFAPTLKSFCILFMLSFLSKWKISEPNFFLNLITRISIISYSIYLLNRTIVIDILIKHLIHKNIKELHIAGYFWFLDYLLFWVITYFLATLLYHFIEQPFIKLRDSKN